MNLRRFFRSIRVRLTLWYVLLLAVVLIAFSGMLYLALRVALYYNLDNALRNSATLLTNALDVDTQGHLTAVPDQLSAWSDSQAGEHFWRVLDPAGRVIGQTGMRDVGDVPVDPTVVATALAGREVFYTVHLENELMRLYTAPVYHAGQVAGVAQLGLALDSVQETLAAFLTILGVALPATLVAASAGGIFLAGRALRPVDRITRAAQSISAHDLSQPLHLNLPDDELGRLARTFDAMIARLDESFRRQRRFTADASHELRTPLTIVKGNLSLALNRPRDADYYCQTLVEVDEEVNHMSRLVEHLLILARADAEGISLQQQTVDLSILLADLTEQVCPLAEAKGLTLTAEIAPDLTAYVDADAVTQMVLNLLENAIKYTPSGQVRLSAHYATPKGGEIQIAVSDSGPGVPAEHQPHIFERFYRVDQARSRELGGVGLGLAIAREMARAHGGDITVHSVPGEGSTFTVNLPDHSSTG